jgi:hypothetical protein
MYVGNAIITGAARSLLNDKVICFRSRWRTYTEMMEGLMRAAHDDRGSDIQGKPYNGTDSRK